MAPRRAAPAYEKPATAVAPVSAMRSQSQAQPQSQAPGSSRRREAAGRRVLTPLAPLLTVALALALWEMVARLGRYQEFILPRPLAVFNRLRELLADGTMPANTAATLQEALIGFALAALVALPLGYALAHLPLAERFLSPLIAASQAVPAVAVAPLLVLWLGNGSAPKVAVCAVIVFFPLVVTTITGVRGVAREYLEVARVFGAGRAETIRRVEVPLAAPVLLGGVKLGLTLSLTGAVVGEFVAADQGLGFLLNFYRDNFDTPALFATLLTLAILGIALYAFITLLERIVAQWQG
jgi:NitT/TauT family transport system permease protein